jgi:hypothetical protein
MRKFKFLALLLLISFSTFSQSRSRYSNELEIQFNNYENGRVCFTIFNYCKKEKHCIEQAKSDAVKMVLFRGFNQLNKIDPIIRDFNTQEKFKLYFDEFFKKNGQFLNYVEYSEDFNTETIQIAKRKNKSAMNVCVSRDNLLKEMQNQKIIKMLSDGF